MKALNTLADRVLQRLVHRDIARGGTAQTFICAPTLECSSYCGRYLSNGTRVGCCSPGIC